ncbi:shikimate dehydrogenase [Okibacterium endophyticum]
MSAKLAVLGSPIEHSRSPLLHRTALDMLGLDWSYERLDVGEDALARVVGGLDRSWRGLSLTMPLKREALRLADAVDEIAEQTGAVNTLRFNWRDAGRTITGYNTDVAGLTNALRAVDVGEAPHVVIVGSGATATSAMVGAAELGALHVDVLARNPQKAVALVDIGRAVGLTVGVHPLSAATEELARPELVISTLPGGVQTPVKWPATVMASAALLDVAYDPWPSPLAAAWTSAGGVVANGLAMLVHQAVVQLRIFVADDPFAELDGEEEIVTRMLSVVGLDRRGQPVGG